MKLFVPITKVDAKQRMVFGAAAVEQADKSGEIFDYAGSKPHFERWSADFAKASGGKSLGNVRAMHGKVAAGKLEQLAFNDTEKRVEVGAKVVDDGEWAKVEEGVYTGFSIGGSYEKRWKDPDDEKLTRYIARPSEISLVDNPCMPGATFTMVKADGAEEVHGFKAAALRKWPDKDGADDHGRGDGDGGLSGSIAEHEGAARALAERADRALRAGRDSPVAGRESPLRVASRMHAIAESHYRDAARHAAAAEREPGNPLHRDREGKATARARAEEGRVREYRRENRIV